MRLSPDKVKANNLRTAIALLGLVTLLGWLWFPSVVLAQEQIIVVEARVVNATRDGVGVEGLTVMLHQESPTDHKDMEEITDAEGWVRFDAVVFDSIVVYGLSVRYEGVIYGHDLDLSGSDVSPIMLTVYDSTSNDEVLSFSSTSVLFSQVDKSDQTISALEIVKLFNNSNHSYVPGPDPMNLLRFGLPPGSKRLQVESGLPRTDFVQVDRGFALLSSVPPGEHEVMYAYQFPYSEAEVTFNRVFNYGAGTLRVLTPDELVVLSANDIGKTESISIGGRSYQLIQADGIPRGTQISLTIKGLPFSSLDEKLRQRLRDVPFEYLAPVGLGLFMVLLVCSALWRKGRGGRRTP